MSKASATLNPYNNHTLDPEDWSTVRSAAHRALDTVLDIQASIRERPAWRPVPEASQALLSTTRAPQRGVDFAEVVDDMLEHIAPYTAGHAHPRFWGWVCGTGTPIGMVADMIAAGVNASSGTFNDAPSQVEAQVIRWMRDLMGFPEGSSGILTSGASVANIVGLAVARDAQLGADAPRGRGVPLRGLGSFATPTVYASAEVHSSVDKAIALLGIGRENLRKVPVDENFKIRPEALLAAIEADRAAGYRPIALVANAGSVNTGAIDDLQAMADIAEQQDLWLHVDGAIGALAVISPKLRPRFAGIERADSIAFDFHKWLYVPYEAGCVLVRDIEKHRASFTVAASYLQAPPRGVGAQGNSSNTRGPQLSRGFKALKVWAQLRAYGLGRLGRMLEQNVEQVQHLARLVDASPELERLAPAALNILCFRYRADHLDETALDALNLELMMRLQESGVAVPSGTRIGGRFSLRVANTNQRTRHADFDLLIRETLRIGRSLASAR